MIVSGENYELSRGLMNGLKRSDVSGGYTAEEDIIIG